MDIFAGKYPVGLLSHEEMYSFFSNEELTELEKGAISEHPVRVARKALAYIIAIHILPLYPDVAQFVRQYEDIEKYSFANIYPISKKK